MPGRDLARHHRHCGDRGQPRTLFVDDGLEETDEEIKVYVKGDDVGLLIGKQGVTIDALQHLAIRLAFLNHRGDRKAVVVDAAGYRDRREAALQRAADQAVAEALRDGRAVEREPMGAYERRTVHTYLRDRTDIQTHSEGDEPGRVGLRHAPTFAACSSHAAYACSTARLAAVCLASDFAVSYAVAHAAGSASSRSSSLRVSAAPMVTA